MKIDSLPERSALLGEAPTKQAAVTTFFINLCASIMGTILREEQCELNYYKALSVLERGLLPAYSEEDKRAILLSDSTFFGELRAVPRDDHLWKWVRTVESALMPYLATGEDKYLDPLCELCTMFENRPYQGSPI